MSPETLALLGGTPVIDRPLPRYNTIGDAEKQAVIEVLDTGELSGFVASPTEEFFGGPRVRALEDAFRRHFGVRHALAVNSATSGLHAALMAMDLGPGDEVIVSPYTMHASATTIVLCGAVPVFADVEAETFCLDPDAVAALVTPRTRGIMAVNIFGHPAALDPLRTICDRYGLFLIEDNAQAPDADYRKRKTGTVGDAGVFSFNRHKTIQCGEGGIVITDDDRVARKVALFRNHGEAVVDAWAETDLVNTLGLNYRMGEMEAAVAAVQFSRLPELNRRRIALCDRLTAHLAEIEGLTAPVVAEGCSHVYYFYVMKLDEQVAGLPRDLFAQALQAEGFPARAGYLKPIYLEPMYRHKVAIGRDGFPWSAHPAGADISYAPGLCPTVERLQGREVVLTGHIHSQLEPDAIDRCAEAIGKVLRHSDALRRFAASQAAE